MPQARHTPIPIPHHWKAKVKESLYRDVEKGIIAPVPIGSPVTWCSLMVVVSKKDGTPQRTIDFQRLNAQCQCETHHTSTPFQLASQVPPYTKKSVIDAVDGFHSVELDSESQPLTTPITSGAIWRVPQGFFAARNAYTCRYDEITDGVERKVKIVDDTLLYDNSIDAKKSRFCQDTVNFARLTLTSTGVIPSEKPCHRYAISPHQPPLHVPDHGLDW